MSVEGIWKVEMLGPYGWEQIATAFLKKGRYLAASADHYSIGSYKVEDKQFKADLSIMQYGKVRALFGSNQKQINVQMDGKIKKQDVITGQIQKIGKSKYYIEVCMTRLGGLD